MAHDDEGAKYAIILSRFAKSGLDIAVRNGNGRVERDMRTLAEVVRLLNK